MNGSTRRIRSAGDDDPALQHWAHVVAFASQLVGSRSEAEDLAQEAYLRYFASRSQRDRAIADSEVRALLFTIVLNRVRSDARRRVTLELIEPVESRGTDPVELAIGDEERVRLGEALAALQPAWRAMLFLADGLDCSYAEIAGVLGTSTDVVRTTLHRARRRLREILSRSLQRHREQG